MPAMTPPLPARPWTRHDVPLVWRSDASIEMGWPPHAVRLDDVDPAHVSWLLSLGGERPLDATLDEGRERGLRPAKLRRLLRAAVRCGLVDDASSIPASLRDASLHVRDLLVGDLAATRHLHGSTDEARDVIDRRRHAEVAVDGTGAVADVVAMVLTCAGIGKVVRDPVRSSSSRRHRRGVGDRVCHVLCDAAHPDAAADPDAMALDIPHLAVAAGGARAVIGPLVIPGRTSCLRCRDLHLADADPSWARVAVQWAARTPGPIAAGLAHLSGAVAAMQVLAVVDAGPATVRTTALEGALVVTLPDGRIEREARPPHPLCGCLWPDTGRGTHARGRQGLSAPC
jgi:bacteriocin biosynthesis cyclodehydratase domain-containing protein